MPRAGVAPRPSQTRSIFFPGPFLDFLDPWGNRLEVVDYADVQFTKAPHILRGMGLDLNKSEQARRELAQKGMADPRA
ncbi:MAG: hypothetical protein JO110_15935 [Acetobacteraceae bacterium]|nr:hypothetical protein [Acetobacteraceae bacterium]